MHESLDPQIELPETRRHLILESTTRRTSRIQFDGESGKRMSVRFDNSSIPAKENILSNEKVPILRLQSQQHVTPKTSIADFGRTTPRKSRSNSRSNSKSTELLRPIHNLRMSRYFRQARPNASVYSPTTQRSNATPLVIELNILLANMSLQERLEKAARHLNDALYLRTVRHDIDITDSKFLKWVYYIQTNLNSQTFLYLLTWVFLGLTYLEPPNAHVSTFFDDHPSYFTILVCIESPIVFLFLLEMAMELYHSAHDPRSFKQKYWENKKIVFKIILNLLFLIDFLFFYISDVHITLRFSRPVRPFCLAMYSKQLRRTIDGIIKSIRQMIDVILFFVILTIIYAAIGIRIIGDLDGEVPYDEYSTNFKDFGPAMNIMYVLLSKDNYPDVMIPSITSSPYYFFYFIPFVAINTLLFVPIPIAVIFDAFRAYRAELVVSERIKEREALVACFISLDIDGSGTISKEEFMSLCTATYGNNLDEEKVDEIYHLLDEKNQGRVTLDNFFSLAELMEDTKNLSKSTFIKFPPWDYLRKIINKIFKFDLIIKHTAYEIFMSLVVLFNTVVLIVYAVVDDENTLNVLDSIDDILVYIYISEIVIKIFGMGIYNYFTDRWNLLDFCLTVVSLVTEAAVSFGKIARTAKAGRLLRLSRAQRALKLLKVLRSVKLFRCLRFGLKSLSRMKRFVQNIMLCLPIVLKLTVVMFMISYCYAIIGMEIFHSTGQVRTGDSPYNDDNYANFDSFGGALLILFQVVVQAKWGDLLFEWAWRFDDLAKSSLYFNTFYSITNLIIISLLTGLIWEVFTYMEKQFEQQDKIDEQLEEIYLDKFGKKKNTGISIPKKHTRNNRFSRDISMSELSFANMNESKRDIRQVKSMNTIDMSSPSPFPDAMPLESPIPLKPSNSLAPPGQGESTLQMSTFNFNMQNSNPRMHTILPSRFKFNSIAPSRSGSDAVLLPFKPSGSKEEYDDIEQALEQIDSRNEVNESRPGRRQLNVNTRNLDSPSLYPDQASPDLMEALDMSLESQRKDRYKSVDIGDTVPDFKIKESSIHDSSPKYSRILARDAQSTYSINTKPVPLDDNYPLSTIRNLRRALSKHSPLPYLNKGDIHHVKAETDKSLEGSMCAEEEAKSINTQDDRNKIPKTIQNKRIQQLNKNIMKEESFDFGNMSHNTSFATGRRARAKMSMGYKDKSAYKFARSDSMNTSMGKSAKLPIAPIVNETFISDAKSNESGGEAIDAKSLEKEFYMRKITVCKYISTEKNQLGYINKKDKDRKKFKLEYKLLRLGSSDSEDSEEEKDKYTKSEHDLTVSEAKMRYLETLKKKMQSQISQPGDRILRKALLQNQNENVIQKYEDEHFREIYGQWFEYLKNPKIERIKNVFDIENKILIRFMRLMKQDEIVSKDFVEITNMIEESINKNLLRKGSLGKFLFRDIHGKWFFVFKDNHKFKVHYLSGGFWNYFEDVFPDKTKLYEGQDILFPGLNDKYAEPVDQLYTSLKKLAHRLIKSKFTDFEKNEHLWNMYMIPFQVSSKKYLKREVFKQAKERPKIDITNLQNTLITDGVFVSVNYIMKAKNLQNMEKESRIDTSQIIQMEKERKKTMQKGYENLQRIARPQKLPRRRTSLSVQASGPSSDVQEVQIQKRMPIHELFKNDSNDMNGGHQGKSNKTEEFLPLQEYIDFMKDIRDALNLHKDHLLIKFSTFYSELCSKNRAKHE